MKHKAKIKATDRQIDNRYVGTPCINFKAFKAFLNALIFFFFLFFFANVWPNKIDMYGMDVCTYIDEAVQRYMRITALTCYTKTYIFFHQHLSRQRPV